MKRSLWLVAWLVTLVVFFMLGLSSVSSFPTDEVGKPETAPQPELELRASKIPGASPPALKTDVPRSYASGDYRRLLDSGLADPYGDPRLFAFLGRVPPQYFDEIIQDTLSRRWVDTHAAGSILGLIYGRWANQDLGAAMQSAFDIRHPSMRDDALAAVVGFYASEDPFGALEYYKAHLHGEAQLNNRMGGRIIRNLARVDPERAVLETAAFLETGEGPGWMTNELARGLLENATAGEALKLTAQVENLEFQQEMVSAIISNDIWRNERPLKTLATVQQLPAGALRDHAMDRFVINWAMKRPAEASDWLMTQPDESLKSDQAGAVFNVWLRINPTAAAEWLNRRPITPKLDAAVEHLVQQIMRKGNDPATAFTWALSYSDESERRGGDTQWTLKKSLEQGADPAELQRTVDESNLSESEKRILHSLIRQSR